MGLFMARRKVAPEIITVQHSLVADALHKHCVARSHLCYGWCTGQCVRFTRPHTCALDIVYVQASVFLLQTSHPEAPPQRGSGGGSGRLQYFLGGVQTPPIIQVLLLLSQFSFIFFKKN